MQALIRNYKPEDAKDIGKFNFIFQLSYENNKDFIAPNIFCAVLNNQVVASGHIEPTDSCEYLDKDGKGPEYIHRFSVDIDSNDHEDLEADIFEHILGRAKEIANQYPDKYIQVSQACSHNDIEFVDFLFEKGFCHSLNYFIMKRDLTKPLPDYPINYNIEIKRWVMETVEERKQYLQAEKDGYDGESWSLAKLNWYKSGPEWDAFTAFHQDSPISSCMTWGISDKRSATEQIFTLPQWRGKGLAKKTILEALRFLRDHKHKTEATLGVAGDNKAAINLYKSLGYELIDIHLLMVKDIV